MYMLQSSRSLGLVILGVLASTLAAPAFGQINTGATLSDQTLREGNSDRSAYSLGNGNLNITQLMHLSNLNNSSNAQNFQRNQNENIDGAVSGYRKGQSSTLQLDTLFARPGNGSNPQRNP